MPEGPEIRRARDELAAAIEGQIADCVTFHLPALASWNGRFDGERILSVSSRGKAMLTHFSNGYSIYSHNQLYGRWLVSEPDELPDTRRQLRLAIHTSNSSTLLYSASDIEIWPTGELHQHPFLKKLGPDVLAETLDGDTVCARLRSPRFYRRQLGAFLRCQPWRAKRRLVDPSSREAALFSRRALRQRENKVGLRTRRPVIGRQVRSSNELAKLLRSAG